MSTSQMSPNFPGIATGPITRPSFSNFRLTAPSTVFQATSRSRTSPVVSGLSVVT